MEPNTDRSGDIAIIVEQDEGQLVRVSLELASKARELADRLKVRVAAILVGGEGCAGHVAELASYGVDRVFLAEDRRLRHYETRPYEKLVMRLLKQCAPQIVLFGATAIGRDIAPRIASSLRTGLTADCTALEIGEHTLKGKVFSDILLQIRPAWGGNTIATIVSPEHRPQMATVRAGVMKLLTPDRARRAEVIKVAPELSPDDFVQNVIERVSAAKKVDLTAANIIVSGGAGVGSKDAFKLIFELADVLGGLPGASRAAVDSGYCDRDYQVGQTGTTVRPKLYIACGISGAIQHRAGMCEASKIVAINNDPTAPIFSIAHYGIIGDLTQVIPRLIKAYRTAK